MSKPEKAVRVGQREETPKTPKIKTPLIKDNFIRMDVNRITHKEVLLKFVEWFVAPPKKRVPRTKGEFAKKYGVSPDTLTDWIKRVGFFDEVKIRSEPWRQNTAEVLEGLLKACKKGNPSAIKIWLEKFEHFSTKLSVDAPQPIRQFAPEQAAQIDQALTHIGLASILAKNHKGYGKETTPNE